MFRGVVMNACGSGLAMFLLTVVLASQTSVLRAQPAPAQDTDRIKAELADLQKAVKELGQADIDRRLTADVDVYAKAAEWALRHDEFHRPAKSAKPSPYSAYTLTGLETGLRRANELTAGKPSWIDGPGTTVRGYYSKIDGSVQPYALTLPEQIDRESNKRYPLFVKLHGRSATRTEVRFIHDHDNKPVPDGQTWVQLDVFGRGNNAYRWSGETDVFEAIEDAKRRVRIDTRRITLWGFSMGGAGSWHLGLHHPSMWASVGPGAGFVDFYTYLNQAEQLPAYQHDTLHIYDAIDYALNAFNVPICAYAGELDKQLAAGTRMAEKAKTLQVPLQLLVGPETGHKFHPESFQEFMAFHQKHSQKGRPGYPGRQTFRFVTYTLKYNSCEWLTIEEMDDMYNPAVVETNIDLFTGKLALKTENVAAMKIARDAAEQIVINGTRLPLLDAADGLLQDVYYRFDRGWWGVMGYADSKLFALNTDRHKRHNLQGPIDDAFMGPFVCVRGTGQPWSKEQAEWADWTLDRFAGEFDKWLRGRVPIVDDKDLDDATIEAKNLILFGDPGSNSVLAKILEELPIQWTKEAIEVNGEKYDPATHGLSLIFPNPLNEERYVVINSGHTFHEKDFQASNAWLFPRLGDVAVQRFVKQPEGGYEETTLWAALFDTKWQLP